MNTSATSRRRSLLVAATVAAGLLVAACGEDNSVGDAGLLEFDPQQQGGAFGATTVPTTISPIIETTAPPATPPPTQATADTVAATLPPEQQEVTVEVSINTNSPYYDPGVVTVLVGSKVRFTNRDTVAREIVSNDGSFAASGPIPPGGVFIFEATFAGEFNYGDPARPFAQGKIIVQ